MVRKDKSNEDKSNKDEALDNKKSIEISEDRKPKVPSKKKDLNTPKKETAKDDAQEVKKAKDWGRASNDPRNKS